MNTHEIEGLKQIRVSLVNYREKSFDGMVKRLFEMEDVHDYREILHRLKRLGHNIVPFEVSDDMFDLCPEGGINYYWIEPTVVKEKVDAAIAYIDSCLPKPPKKIGFQQTPVL